MQLSKDFLPLDVSSGFIVCCFNQPLEMIHRDIFALVQGVIQVVSSCDAVLTDSSFAFRACNTAYQNSFHLQ